MIGVLRKGVDHGPLHFDLFYATPSEKPAARDPGETDSNRPKAGYARAMTYPDPEFQSSLQ